MQFPFILLSTLCLSSLLYAEKSYFICIDGGGSKTSLQVLDSTAQPLLLEKNGEYFYTITSSSSNINTVGQEGFNLVLDELLADLYLDKEKISYHNAQVIGGFAGLGSLVNQQKVLDSFKQRGFSRDQLHLKSDATLALELISTKGIVLIAGTGSIAYGLDNGKELRAGGFGRLIGDEGSGYSIGIKAIKASLEEEFGYGDSTSLTSQIKEFYNVQEIKDLIPKIHGNIMQPSEIAELSPIVFASAYRGDVIAKTIIQNAAQELAKDILHILKRMNSSYETIPVFIIGGLFKDNLPFVEEILKSDNLQLFLQENHVSLRVVDLSDKNIAVEVVKAKI